MKILVPVDGSEQALAALDFVASRSTLIGQAPEVHLINVQRPLSSDVTRFIAGRTVEDYQRERSDQALVPARAIAATEGARVQEHRHIGIAVGAMCATRTTAENDCARHVVATSN